MASARGSHAEPNSVGQGQPSGNGPAQLLGGRTAWIVLTVGQFAAIVAVLQRSSLGVAATAALDRFGITAATLGAFIMVQLLIYSALQVPVGTLIDRYGSKRLVIAGSLLMAGAQVMFAAAHSLPVAFAARVVLGIGDALTFIAVMRLIPAWFPPQRSGMITNATGQLFQLGFLVSAVGFGAVLMATDWTTAFLVSAALSLVVGAVVLLLLRDSPSGRPPLVPLGRALAVAAHDVRSSWAEPGTRLGFWVTFLTLFTPMMFGVMWGYPFLTIGQGLPPTQARLLMSVLAVAAVALGPTIGLVMTRHPFLRSLIAIGITGVTMAVWTAVLLWPGPAPMWLLVVLVTMIPANSVSAVMAFDFARMFNPASRLGAAIGLVNVGGFTSTLVSVIAIGLVLDLLTPPGSTDYSLDAFRWAFATSYVLWAVGLAQVLRYRSRTQRVAEARDPEAYAAYRRGVHLPPPI
jgi:nitrate/nitrite transporter NarK